MMIGHHGNGSQRRDAGEAAVCPGRGAGGCSRGYMSWSRANFQPSSRLMDAGCL